MHSDPRRPRGAFTILEVLIVICIIALMMLVVVGYLRQSGKPAPETRTPKSEGKPRLIDPRAPRGPAPATAAPLDGEATPATTPALR
jgi:hypothetical protein